MNKNKFFTPNINNMKKSKVVCGDKEDIVKEIDKYINEGYKVHTFLNEAPSYFYALLIKE